MFKQKLLQKLLGRLKKTGAESQYSLNIYFYSCTIIDSHFFPTFKQSTFLQAFFFFLQLEGIDFEEGLQSNELRAEHS